MYTIKQAATMTGLGAPLIRAWERRYGVVRPVRTPSGYRLYDDEAIHVLLTMRALVGAGWTASEAARAIGAGEVPVDRGAVPPRGARATDAAVADGTLERRAAIVARFVAAAEGSSPEETEAVLDEILAMGSFESVVDDILLPALAALGDSWAAGTLSVAGEHAASAAVARRLAAVFQAAGIPSRPSVVVGLPPGSRHELGAFAFAVALRRRGAGVLYLGQDVSLDGWLDAVERTGVRAAVVGVVTPDDRESAAAVVEALLERRVPIVAVGGAAAATDFDPDARLLVLPARVGDAARVIADALRRRRA